MTLDEERRKLREALDWLQTLAGDKFLCGNELTVADIAVASQLSSLTSPFNKPTAAEVTKRHGLATWFDRVKSAVA